MVESILVLFIQTGAEIGVGAGKETKKTELVKYRPALHQFMCRPLLPPPPPSPSPHFYSFTGA